MSDASEDALRRRLHELASQFLARTESEVCRIRTMLEGRHGEALTLEPLIMLAHKICGTASTFQFDNISACAGELEQTATTLSAMSHLEKKGQERLAGLTTQLAHAVDRTRQAFVGTS